MKLKLNLKSFISGIIIGGIIFTIIPVGAAIQEYICYKADYKVMINGVEYTNNDLPILSYKGNTYAPFRSILEAAGLDVNWNGTLKQAEVNSKITTNTIEGGDNVSETTTIPTETETITQTPDGITQIDTWEGKQYIAFIYIKNKIKEKGYDFIFNAQTKTWQVIKGEDVREQRITTGNKNLENNVILDNVQTTMLKDYGYDAVEINYYINTILPLIK